LVSPHIAFQFLKEQTILKNRASKMVCKFKLFFFLKS